MPVSFCNEIDVKQKPFVEQVSFVSEQMSQWHNNPEIKCQTVKLGNTMILNNMLNFYQKLIKKRTTNYAGSSLVNTFFPNVTF